MGRLILIIEDDPDIRESLELVLTLEGYRTITASNGREGLAHLDRADPPSLILLDLMMPVMNGWDFLSAQRATRSATIPVVVVSAAGEAARPVDADAYVAKPVDLDRLLDVVHQFCP
jgi:DNA-binding response OmpR family regulator